MRARRVLAAAVLVLAAASSAGCGVRLDTPPPAVPTAEAAEHDRQQAALAAHDLYQSARTARDAVTSGALPAADGVVEVLIAIETAATEHHRALGGVWEPWPGAGPEATAYPEDGPATPAPPAETSPQGVLNLLEAAAADAHQGAIAQSGELSQLLASVAISRTYLAEDLGRVLSVPVDLIPARPLPAPEPDSVDPATSRAVDAARYAFEVVAARSDESQREAAAERAAQLAAVAGAVAPEEDRREVAYDVSIAVAQQGSTTPERALAGAAELDVVAAYLALLAGEGNGRDAVLAAATYAAGQARSWDTALPALPGLS